jgi:hypothetical protein
MTGPIFGDSENRLEGATPEEDFYKQKEFVRFDLNRCLKIAQMAASKEIEPRDIMVLLAIISMTNWKNGRCLAATAKIADLLPLSISQVGHSMRRLKKQNLIVPLKDTKDGFTYHLVDPYLIICGTGSKRGIILKNYHQAIYKNTPFSDRIQVGSDGLTDEEFEAMLLQE